MCRWCVNYVSNTLTPRTAEKYLNDAATMSDNVPNKMSLVKQVLQWAGDNITTLRDRQLINNMDKSALIMLSKYFRTKNEQRMLKLFLQLNLDFYVCMRMMFGDLA